METFLSPVGLHGFGNIQSLGSVKQQGKMSGWRGYCVSGGGERVVCVCVCVCVVGGGVNSLAVLLTCQIAVPSTASLHTACLQARCRVQPLCTQPLSWGEPGTDVSHEELKSLVLRCPVSK